MPDWILWTLASCLLLVGLIGCVVPFVPGPSLIFATATAFRFLGPEGQQPSWPGLLLLLLLLVTATVLDFVATGFGAKRFGGTRWGMLGAVAGTIVGGFFLPFGILIGPFVGAVAGELWGRRQQIERGELGWGQWQEVGRPAGGSLLGLALNAVGQFVIGLIMVTAFLLDCLWL